MRFFFDRNMSPRLARMIDVYDIEHTVRHHDEDPRFHKQTPDTEWMRTLAGDDPAWVVVSGDGRILRNKAERAVLREANLTFFYLTAQWTHMKVYEFAWKFLKVWPVLIDNADLRAPRIFEVGGGKGLKVTMLGLTKH
jgi:PIN like domain